MFILKNIKGKFLLFFSLVSLAIIIVINELTEVDRKNGESYYRILHIELSSSTYHNLSMLIEYVGIGLMWVVGGIFALNIWQLCEIYLFPKLKGGVNLARTKAQQKAQDDALDRMLKLGKLREQGALTEQEYEQKLKELKKLI